MYILIDFEATCWDIETLAENEIIEIGAALINEKFEIINTFDIFVRPLLNPTLSDFCKKLTSITQEDIDNAQMFPDAWRSFEAEIKKHTNIMIKDLLFCSWGYYDNNQLKHDCQLHNIKHPFNLHFSIKHLFAERHNIKPCGTIQALKIMGMKFEGTHHRAIDDIKNIAKIFIKEYKTTGFLLKTRI